MIKGLTWSNNGQISWLFDEKYIEVFVKGLTDVYYDQHNKIIHVKVEEKFILLSEILFNSSGNIILEYNLAEKFLKWQYGCLTFQNLKQVLYISKLNVILVLDNNNIGIIDFVSGKAEKVIPSSGYKIDYIDIELLKGMNTLNSTEKIIVICDGNDNKMDVYSRSRRKFYLDIFTKKLVENGLYY